MARVKVSKPKAIKVSLISVKAVPKKSAGKVPDFTKAVKDMQNAIKEAVKIANKKPKKSNNK